MGSGGKDKEPRQKKKPGRVPTSCAECRRLKLRCDRNVPCEKCVSRGCGSICPDGVLSGRNGRLVLANTEELHDRIEQLSSRNRDLEKALRKLQESVSDQPHPLLGADLPKLNFQHGSSSSGPSTSSGSKSPSTSRVSPMTHPQVPMEVTMDDDGNALDAYGTLSINRRGETSFLGRTARADYLIHAFSKPQTLSRPTVSRLSQRIMAASLPDSELYTSNLLSEILQHLPLQTEALHLCDVYLEYGNFLYFPISRKELLEETLNPVYRAKQFAGFDHYHSLSLLLIIFAIAALFDPAKPPFSPEAHEYYHLSRAVLGFAPPFQETTLTSIQTLIHMAQYLDLSDAEPGAPDFIWAYMGQATSLSQKIGLHLSSSRWKLPDVTSERRHELFWRLFVSDVWVGSQFGRPPNISSAHIDCPRPPDIGFDDASPSYYSWNLRFAQLLHSVVEATSGSKQPVYANILDFDRQLRDVDVPSHWRMPSVDEMTSPPTEISMYRWLILSSKEIVLLNLHRAYLAQALQEAPHDLQRHRYLPSVVAAYRSAWRLSRGLAVTWRTIPKFLARVKLAWSHGLSAAIVMSLFASKAPNSGLATAALEELDNLTSLFDVSSSSCRPAAKLLVSVQDLRRRAHELTGPPHTRFYYRHEANDASGAATNSITASELDRLNGKTTFLSDYPSSSTATAASASSSSADSRSRATSVTISESAEAPYVLPSSVFHSEENIHPSLTQDLRDFATHNAFSPSFFDYPSATHAPRTRTPLPLPIPSPHDDIPIPGPSRLPEEPPESSKFFSQQAQQSFFSIPPRVESLTQTHDSYFSPQSLQFDPFIDPRKTVFGSGLQPGFQSGFSGGFGAIPPIVLDPSWHSLVEQLGYSLA